MLELVESLHLEKTGMTAEFKTPIDLRYFHKSRAHLYWAKDKKQGEIPSESRV